MAKFNNNSKGDTRNSRGGYNKPNNGGKRKSPINFTTYVKSFDSFETAINDMIANNDVVWNTICESEKDAENLTEEAVYERICSLPSKHIPNPVSRQNVLWEYTISSNRVSIKTDQFVAFGWNIKSKRVDDHFESTYYCRISIFGDNAMAKKALEDAGWNVEERKNNGRRN